MQDIRFNPKERDIILNNGDFAIADDTSCGYQNGFIMAGAAPCSPLYPALGLSLNDSIGGHDIYETLSRWSNMIITDGGTKGDFEYQRDQKSYEIILKATYK